MVVAQQLTTAPEQPALIGGRYHVQQLLGRGGMAEVYRVRDASTQRVLALKRLIQREDNPLANHIVQLFEHEFHTLSQLVHPRIIEAYDYNRDQGGPYYTMELLDGGDLRELSPLPWQHAAKLLADTCSALSLLHSRRLLHRDLTPLNIRCTRDGRAKLFDFGSMAHNGVSKHVVGTPPFVAPEALAGQVLDARTDLFALGATAYFALTGTHAFPARSLAALDELWRRPIRPLSQLLPDVPPALEDLIMSLLQLAPDHRPDTAAEVMERLSAIAGFALDDSLQVQRAYLATPSLVGRDEMLIRARKHLQRAQKSKGGALVIQGPAGVGRSRFLDACALEAKLAGALVLRADASDASAGKWSAAGALLRQLIAAAPELAQQTLMPHAAALSPVLPNVIASLNLAPLDAQSALDAAPSGVERDVAELRAAAQTALRSALCQVAEQRLLMIAVDDVHHLDEPSGALIALLAQEARQRQLLVFATTDIESEDVTDRAISLLLATSDSIRLRNLSPQETQQLLTSLFGGVPNVRFVADRLHAAASGNPGVLMQMAQQLLDRELVRYSGGAWLLPDGIDVSDLTSSLSARFEATVASLSPNAAAVTEALSLCTLRSLSFDDFALLTAIKSPQALLRALDELVRTDVLGREDNRYFFRRPQLERIVARRLEGQFNKSAIHKRAALLFSRRPNEEFRTALHLLHSGEPDQALDILVPAIERTREGRLANPAVMFDFVNSLPKNWRETFQALIHACETLGRPKRDRFVLQVNLVAYTMMMGGSEIGHLRELAAQLRHDAGLDIYEQLIKEPLETRLHAALASAIQRYESTPDHDRVLAPFAAIPRLAQTIMFAVGVATRTLDYELLAGMPSLVPFLPLSPALEVVHNDVQASLLILSGDFERARTRFLEVLARLEQPDHGGIDPSFYIHLRLGVIMALGQLEVAIGMPSADRWAPALEASPFFAVTGWRMRVQGALTLGDLRKAEEYRAHAERLQIQNCPAQLFEGLHLLPQVSAQSDAEDLLTVKQSVVEIEAMAAQFPTWQPSLYFARGVYQALRGDTDRALQELDRAIDSVPQGRHIAWLGIAARIVQLLNRAGRFAEAAERGRGFVAILRQQQLSLHTFPIMAALGLAEAALGNLALAVEYTEAAINDIEMRGARGVTLGFAYEMRARVALYAKDADAFDTFGALCEEQYRAGQNSALIGRYKRLLRDAGAASIVTTLDPGALTTTVSAEETPNTLETLLSSCNGPRERAERALRLIATQSHSQGGHLYTIQNDGPVLVASYGTASPLPNLDQLVRVYLTTALEDLTDMEATTVDVVPTAGEVMTKSYAIWRNYTPMLLSHTEGDGAVVAGVAVMLSPTGSLHRIPYRLLNALAKTLIETGDVTASSDDSWRSRLEHRPSRNA